MDLGAQGHFTSSFGELSETKSFMLGRVLSASDCFYTVRPYSLSVVQPKKVIVNKYDLQGSLIFFKELSLPKLEGKDTYYFGTEIIEKKLNIFAYSYEKKSKALKIIAFIVSDDGGISEKDSKLITTFNGLYKFMGEITFQCKYAVSDDKSKIVFYRTNFSTKKVYAKNFPSPKFEYAVTDNKLNQLWKKESVFPIQSGLMKVKKCVLPNNGNSLHFIITQYGGVDQGYSMEERFSLFSCYKGKSKSKILDLNFPNNNKIHEVELYTEHDDLLFFGTTSNSSGIGIVDSYNSILKVRFFFFLRVNQFTHDVENKEAEEVSKDVIVQNLGQKRYENGFGIHDFNITNVFTSNTKDCYYVVGQILSACVRPHTYSSYDYACEKHTGGMYGDVNSMHNIIVIKLSKEGKILWDRTIEKHQSSFSILSDLVNQEFYFVFNENEKNNGKTIKQAKETTNNPDSKVYSVKLDAEGNIDKRYLMPIVGVDEVKIRHKPLSYFQKEDNLYIMGAKGKKRKWAKLTLND